MEEGLSYVFTKRVWKGSVTGRGSGPRIAERDSLPTKLTKSLFSGKCCFSPRGLEDKSKVLKIMVMSWPIAQCKTRI